MSTLKLIREHIQLISKAIEKLNIKNNTLTMEQKTESVDVGINLDDIITNMEINDKSVLESDRAYNLAM